MDSQFKETDGLFKLEVLSLFLILHANKFEFKINLSNKFSASIAFGVTEHTLRIFVLF